MLWVAFWLWTCRYFFLHDTALRSASRASSLCFSASLHALNICWKKMKNKNCYQTIHMHYRFIVSALLRLPINLKLYRIKSWMPCLECLVWGTILTSFRFSVQSLNKCLCLRIEPSSWRFLHFSLLSSKLRSALWVKQLFQSILSIDLVVCYIFLDSSCF